jgi:hypothetical protein
MEPEGSLLFSRRPTIGPYLESHESNPHHPNAFYMIQFNIFLTSVPRSSKWAVRMIYFLHDMERDIRMVVHD